MQQDNTENKIVSDQSANSTNIPLQSENQKVDGNTNFANQVAEVAKNDSESVIQTAVQGIQNVSDSAQVATQQVNLAAKDAVQLAQNATKKTANLINTVLNPAQIQQPVVSKEEKIYAAVGYIPVLQVVSLILMPDSSFVRMHTRQGMMLFALNFIFMFFLLIISAIGLQLVAGIIGSLFSLALTVLTVYSIVLAITGNWWKMPVIGQISEIIPIEMIAKFFKDATSANISEAKKDFDNRVDTLSNENVESAKNVEAQNIQQVLNVNPASQVNTNSDVKLNAETPVQNQNVQN